MIYLLINELLHIKYPIIQGAMAFISDGKFAACCSNAGGLGIVAAGELELEQIRKEIRICKSLTDKPFAVNIFMLRDDVCVLRIVNCNIGTGIDIVSI